MSRRIIWLINDLMLLTYDDDDGVSNPEVIKILKGLFTLSYLTKKVLFLRYKGQTSRLITEGTQLLLQKRNSLPTTHVLSPTLRSTRR